MNGCSALHLTMFGLNPVVKFGNDRLKADVPAARRGRRPPRRVRRDRARRRHRHRPHHDPRRARRQGRLAHHRPQDLDDEGTRVGGRPAARAHRRQGQRATGPDAVPRRPRSRLRRHPARSPRSAATRSRRARSRTTACRSRAGASSANEGDGFRQHPPRPQPRARPARVARRAGSVRSRSTAPSTYAKERIVFDRPIGANQAISHPLAHAHMQLKAAWMMALHAGAPLRRRPRMRRGRQQRQVPRRRSVVLRRRPGDADPRRHGLRDRVPRRALLARGPPADASRRSPRR